MNDREDPRGSHALASSQPDSALVAAVFDSSLDAIVGMDHEGRVIEFSRTAEEIFGRKREEVLGVMLEDLIVPTALRSRHRRGLEDYLRTGNAIMLGKRRELTAMRAGGEEFPTELCVTRVPGEGPARFLGCIRDLTAAKRAEGWLREQQRVLLELALHQEFFQGELKAALEEITEAASRMLDVERASVWLYNEDASVLRCQDLYERSRELHSEGIELAGQDCPAYFQALKTERAIAAHDAQQDPRTEEFRKNYLGPLGIVSMLDAPIRVGGKMLGVVCHEHIGPGRIWTLEEQSFAGSLADLVSLALAAEERRKAKEERRRLEEKVRQTQKLESLGLLAGGIAHDFNNLLVGILGNVDLARHRLSPAEPPWEQLDGIEIAGKRAADLCQQMLAYSGKGKFIVEATNLNELVREMAQLLQASIFKKVELHLELGAELPAIEADVTQVRQIVMNLITNASEAIGPEGGRISIRTFLAALDGQTEELCYPEQPLEPGEYLVLEIRDTGCGMDKLTTQRIFDPFFTTKFAGRGLGLAAVLGIVRGHRGGICVDSEEGSGTTVRVLIPALAGVAKPAIVAEAPSADWRGEGLVLLADDEATVRVIGKTMLEQMGFDVVLAEDGRDALERFRERSKDFVCVLLDLTMPRLDGTETFRELRAIRADIPVVLSSGYSETDAVERFEEEGLAGFLHKPYRYQDLAAKLKSVMQGDDAPEGRPAG